MYINNKITRHHMGEKNNVEKSREKKETEYDQEVIYCA